MNDAPYQPAHPLVGAIKSALDSGDLDDQRPETQTGRTYDVLMATLRELGVAGDLVARLDEVVGERLGEAEEFVVRQFDAYLAGTANPPPTQLALRLS